MMLEVPIACCSISNDLWNTRKCWKLLDATTVEDEPYDAINLASAGGMGEQEEYDVQDNAKMNFVK